MTIQEAIDRVDELKPNMMSVRLKVEFLTEIEQMIHDEIILKHAHTAAQEAKPEYSEDTDLMTELQVPDPDFDAWCDRVLAAIDKAKASLKI